MQTKIVFPTSDFQSEIKLIEPERHTGEAGIQ